MKRLLVFCGLCLFFGSGFAQEKDEKLNARDSSLPLIVKVNQQQKVVQSTQTTKNKTTIKHPTSVTKKKEKISGRNHETPDTLKVILTPGQKEKIKEKHPPKRGVTNLPNERSEK